MRPLYGFGIGIGTKNAKGDWLEVYYPNPVLGESETGASLAKRLGYQGGNVFLEIDSATLGSVEELATFAGSKKPVGVLFLEKDAELASVPEAYFKLHLLSHRLVKPHGTNLTGLFKCLPNVAWTSEGPIDLAELPARQLAARLAGKALSVTSVDKFPKMTDYVVPSGVRIADTARVRLGAYLGEGTTVMHEGFINFNAGCDGPNMVEGRISAGVRLGTGTDLGGGASTMGTLSGGGEQVISVGKNCLIGANAGLGIPLGDRCTIEAGLYLTAGAKVRWTPAPGATPRIVKALELAGRDDLLFRRNSLDGAIECIPAKTAIQLNEELHSHN